MLQGLPPHLPSRPRILVLGSFPSQASLEAGRYYAHPRNHFWPILAALAGESAPSGGNPPTSRAVLRERSEGGGPGPMPRARGESPLLPPGGAELLETLGIALWDVYAACEREGSLDQAIEEARPNPFLELLSSEPGIVAVGLNGSAAAGAFLRALASGERGRPFRGLPAVGESFAFAAPARGLEPGLGPGRPLLALRLPSTSPVPTREYRKAEDKLPAWRALLAAADEAATAAGAAPRAPAPTAPPRAAGLRKDPPAPESPSKG